MSKIQWQQIARPEQLIPKGFWNIWLLLAGRGFGKTRAGAEAVLELIKNQRAKHIGIFGETLWEAKEIMLKGTSGILSNSDMSYNFIDSHRKVIFENGAICKIFGANKYDKLRGSEFDLIWIDEFVKFSNAQEVLDQIFMCLRLGESKLIITTTPNRKNILSKIITRKDTIITCGTSFANTHLSKVFHSNAEQYEQTEFGKQEILAQIPEDTSCWKSGDIIYKKPNKNDIWCYSIGVDPAVGPGVTGIIVLGVDNENNIYILGDYSNRESPNNWMQLIKNLCDQFAHAKVILGVEINQGGSLLGDMAKIYNILVPINNYRTNLSKTFRTIETKMFYQLKKIFHFMIFEHLEKEMQNGRGDRVDALHWAIENIKKLIV